MVKTKRAKKKLHKAELTAKVVKYERTTLRMMAELTSEKSPLAQLNAVRSILDLAPVADQGEQDIKLGVQMQPSKDVTVSVNPTKQTRPQPKEAKLMGDAPATPAPLAQAGMNDQLTDLRLDVATTLYTYLCRQADMQDSSYEEVLGAQLKQFQEGSQELDTNDFSDCETKQRIYFQIDDATKAMLDSLAKKMKLPKRAVVESICSMHIRKGAL